MSETIRPRPYGRRSLRRTVLRALAWLCVGVIVLLALLYARLLFGPISLDFLSDRVKGTVAGVVDDGFAVDWTDFGLSLTDPVSLGFHLSDVMLTERSSGAVIAMDALEIGLSPLGALRGRPEARVILVRPEIQMIQDLFGSRLSRFALNTNGATGETLVEISEAAQAMPAVRISDSGLTVARGEGDADPALRSDNDWLISNVEALNAALADLADQAMAGQVVRFEIRDGSVGMLDAVYGLYKSFDSVDIEVRSGRQDGRVSALFSARIGGQTMDGTIVRQIENGTARIDARVDNMDFSTVISFLNDAEGLAALEGNGKLDLELVFDRENGEVASGFFEVDVSGTHLRLNEDRFPVETAPFRIDWTPRQSLFSLTEVELGIGQSRAIIVGDIVLGFDEQFGPTLGISVRARDLWLHPDDLGPPEAPFEEVHFEGWSAPLYGALGIDRMVVARDDASVVMQGRIDMLRDGVGLAAVINGHGASADDLKRLWPYLFASEGRDWFIQFVEGGRVDTAAMRFNFPVGALDMDDKGLPVPRGSIGIDLVGHDIELTPFEGLPEFEVDGEARLSVRDNRLTMTFERARVPEFGDEIVMTNAAFLNQDTSAGEQVFEISGDIASSASAILKIARSETLGLLDDIDIGADIDAVLRGLDGQVETTVIATITSDADGAVVGVDYALNGTVSDLSSTRDIAGLSLDDANFAFTASQEGFRVLGSAMVAGTEMDLQATQTRDGEPDIVVAATLDASDLARFGVDVSEFMGGSARVVARIADLERIAVSADLTDASLTVGDIGISKPRGASGGVRADLSLDEEVIAVSGLDLSFGTVRLGGDMRLSREGALQSADFSTFRISPGDNASVTMTPVSGGYALAVSGRQLDLKPVLQRFFDLEGNAAGPSAGLDDQIFNLRVNLDRALGHYGEAAFNLDLDLSLRGDDLRRINLATQFAGNRTASATTNPLPSGRSISYATNDLGAMLRFVGVYPRVINGDASMVMRHDPGSGIDVGEIVVRDFAIADEDNLDVIVGSHDESRQIVGAASAIEFDYGHARFAMHADRVELLEGAVYGNQVGGTIRGAIFTEAGQYDLAGTYVPLFGLNNFFQQIPILGPIFGGREGEGLLGVTFAVRGPLNDPQLLVNPVSILAPGVFRTLFEYRAANPSAAR